MAARLKRKGPTLPTDPATAYALAVISGKILAGPYVRASCQRHIADLARAATGELQWDVAAVQHIVGFFEDVLTVEIEEADGTSKAIPFILQPWQCFIVGSLFGWKNAKGLRRFRRAYVEVAKGNGKSPMAAGIGHYMLVATKKLRAEVYSAATDRDQAAILFRDAVAMWERSPELCDRLESLGDKAVWQLLDRKTNSFFKPISSEKKGKSGVRPYCALVDEIHEHPDNSVIEMLRAGTKGNQQALMFEITNSGFDRETVCFKEHEYTIKVCNQDVQNDSWFGYISCLDETDKPFEDESCWVKSNPNLGVSIQLPYLREQVREAAGMPSKESLVRRLHFCEWTDAAKTVIPRAVWEKCEVELKLEDYYGERCILALDMSWVKDLTAMAYVFPTGGDTFDAFIDYWTPSETMQERAKNDSVNYPLFVKQGHMFATTGKIIKLEHVAQRIGWALSKFDVQWFTYDKYRLKDLEDELFALGLELPMIEHPQGFRRSAETIEGIKDPETGQDIKNPLWMPDSFQKFESAVIEERLRVAVNPVTRWNISCLAVRDDPAGTGNRVFDKRKALGKIDGAVSLGMGIGCASMKLPPKPKSIFEIMAEANAKADAEKAQTGSATVVPIAPADHPMFKQMQQRMDTNQFGGDDDDY